MNRWRAAEKCKLWAHRVGIPLGRWDTYCTERGGEQNEQRSKCEHRGGRPG